LIFVESDLTPRSAAGRHTRRDFVRQAVAVSIALASSASSTLQADASGGTSEPVLLNQVGFVPGGSKFCLQNSSTAVPFSVVAPSTGQVVFQGTMKANRGDFGRYAVGSFSGLTMQGTFVVQAGGSSSQPFVIGDQVYLSSIRNGVGYFSMQRCGDSTTGYNAPCHIDDGRRLDNGEHQDVTGGWHDACDVRKWTDSTIYGMIGLSRLLDYFTQSPSDLDTIVQELRWGNLYFRKMQTAAGNIMDYCGGDDGNYWTDNIVGTSDDRPIHTGPGVNIAQFHFAGAQATLSRFVQPIDAAYAQSCLLAGERCLQWMVNTQNSTAAGDLAAGAMACVQLYLTTQNVSYHDRAVEYGDELLKLQKKTGSAAGAFQADRGAADLYRDVENGDLPLLALCDLLENFPDDRKASSWQAAISLHCNMLVSMSARSGLGIVPYGFFASGDPGGDRKLGDYWYRWFMEVTGSADIVQFWLGINGNLASTGVGLSRAGTLLKTPSYSSLAQRQLDWILGCNPFNASTVIGAGTNQPSLYVFSGLSPHTPLINGGVMNGIGGTNLDEPYLGSGTYHTCEYYTPMVAYTTWLMAELQSADA
jgi:hypothetical protein